MTYSHVMIDLETVGTVPGSGIISIGAVAFNRNQPEMEWNTFEAPLISVASCLSIGLTTDHDTLDWWLRQAQDARVVFDAAMAGQGSHIVQDLATLSKWMPREVRVWGNGADFDNALLAVAYSKAALKLPWRYSYSRCFRTLKHEVYPSVDQPDFQGIKHSALADALHHTRWLQEMWRS